MRLSWPADLIHLALLILSGSGLVICVPAKGDTLREPVRSFNVDGVSRINAVLLLMKQEKQPLSVEYAGKELFDTITVHTAASNLNSVLQLIFPAPIGFKISTNDDVVVISHFDPNSTRPSVLDTVLSRFSIPKCSLLMAEALLRVQLFREANPNNKAGYGLSISGADNTEIGPLDMKHVTVRDVLNRLVREHGQAAWIIQVRPPIPEHSWDGVWAVVEYDSGLFDHISEITREHSSRSNLTKEHIVLAKRNIAKVQQPINKEDAILAAFRFTQLNRLPGVTVSGREIIVSEDTTPFLANSINGRRAWLVEVDHVTLRLPSADTKVNDHFVRTFHITIDANSGQLLRVKSSGEPKTTTLRPEAGASSAEAQIKSSGERYEGIPDVEPKISLLQALDNIFTGGGGSPFLAQEINASYIFESKGQSPLRRVWVITLRGLPPFPFPGPPGGQVPDWQRNHFRNVVDADSGTLLFCTTVPQPQQ